MNDTKAKADILITREQALSCLYVKPDSLVHSFLKSFFLAGADLDLARVEEMVTDAASTGKLYISDELGGALHHDVVAWDQKYREWTYLECDAGKVELLRKALG